jgi:hypothetical protein
MSKCKIDVSSVVDKYERNCSYLSDRWRTYFEFAKKLTGDNLCYKHIYCFLRGGGEGCKPNKKDRDYADFACC